MHHGERMENQEPLTTVETDKQKKKPRKKYVRSRENNSKPLQNTKAKRLEQQKLWQEGMRTKFEIKRLPQLTSVEIVTKGNTKLPNSLQGMWTDHKIAQRAINVYIETGFKV